MKNWFNKIKKWLHLKRQKYLFEKYVLPCITYENLKDKSFEQLARLRLTFEPSGDELGLFSSLGEDHYMNLVKITKHEITLLFYRKAKNENWVIASEMIVFQRHNLTSEEKRDQKFMNKNNTEARKKAAAAMRMTMEGVGFKSSNDMPDITSAKSVEDLTQMVEELKKNYPHVEEAKDDPSLGEEPEGEEDNE